MCALSWRQREPFKKQTTCTDHGVNKESKRLELVCVLNNLSDLPEMLQEIPFGGRRAAAGSRQSKAKRESIYLSYFVQALFFSVDQESFMVCFGPDSLEEFSELS